MIDNYSKREVEEQLGTIKHILLQRVQHICGMADAVDTIQVKINEGIDDLTLAYLIDSMKSVRDYHELTERESEKFELQLWEELLKLCPRY